MNDIEIVRNFITARKEQYETFLERVRSAAETVRDQLGGEIVTNVYSRGKKQRSGPTASELKDTEKIFAACERPITGERLKAIEDIIGLTIVVQYPDQVDTTLNALMARLALDDLHITEARERKHHKETYFATHMVLQAERFTGIKCEVQCKTMLHDAWSTKMHDLTYKPQGSLDERMKALIESISGTIEGLERQSQIVRNMIQARQTIERRPFQASLDALYSGLSKTLANDWEDGQSNSELVALRERLEEQRPHLTDCSASDQVLTDLRRAIRRANADLTQRRGAWLLAVRLAGFRPDPEHGLYLQDQVDLVMDVLPQWRTEGRFTGREVAAIPMGFYVIQDFTRALEYADRILNDADRLALKPFRRMVLKLNKLTWLLERESLRPSKSSKRAELAQSIEKNLAEIAEEIEGYEIYAPLRPSYRDALGLMLIVFGETKEQVRKGIDECTAALTLDGDNDEQEVDKPYAEWRTQVGWRRYFDLAEKEP